MKIFLNLEVQHVLGCAAGSVLVRVGQTRLVALYVG